MQNYLTKETVLLYAKALANYYEASPSGYVACLPASYVAQSFIEDIEKQLESIQSDSELEILYNEILEDYEDYARLRLNQRTAQQQTIPNKIVCEFLAHSLNINLNNISNENRSTKI